MLTDPIADFLIRIKNGYMAGKKSIKGPFSKINERIAKILLSDRRIKEITVKKIDESKKDIIIELLYINKKPSISYIEKISKPGRKLYVKSSDIPKVLGGMGNTVISTSMGFMTGNEAKKKKIGGEFICKYW
jgi:small subunit ribosomal protein S8